MPYIPLEDHLPGITGLLEYRKDSAAPIRELTQILLRGPSTLTEGERELIATVVSHRNECTFCVTAHTAAANILLGETSFEHEINRNRVDTIVILDKILFGAIFLCLFFLKLISKFDNYISKFTLFTILGLLMTYWVLFFKWSYPWGKRLYP